MFPLCGKTLLEHQVDRLKAAGLKDITFVGGAHNVESVRSLFPKAKTVLQRDEIGMHAALLDALPTVGNDSVLIVGLSDVVDISAYKKVIASMKKGVDGAVLAYEVPRYFPGGYLTLKGTKITGIVEKPGEGNEPSPFVNIVVHAHRSAPELLKELQHTKSEKDDKYEVALASLFGKKNYVAVPYAGAWLPVKFPWHILPLLEYFLASQGQKPKIHKTAKVHKTAVIEGSVVIAEGAQIYPNAVVRGPAYIGKRTIVANNALVRGSSVGDDCVVGYCTEVKGSALARHVWTHMTYIGDSVIGENVSFGAGSVTGNLRFDEGEILSAHKDTRLQTGLTKFGTIVGNNARLGIHTGIAPGIKIGEGTFVNSGAMVTADIPDNSFVSMKGGEMVVRPNKTKAPTPESRETFRKAISRKKS